MLASNDDRPPTRDRIIELADACVKCGLCLPYCPTYMLDRVETESPRGRIALSRHAVDDSLAPDADLRAHLDHCLGCMACQRVCPVPVHYGELLTEYRARLPPAEPRPRLLLRLLTRPGVLRFGAGIARAIGAAHRLSPLARLLPRRSSLRAAISLLPALPVPVRDIPASVAAPMGLRDRVALFGGCVQGALEHDAQDAAALLLAAAGYEVTRIDGLRCGALRAHTGDSVDASRKAAGVKAASATGGIETLLTANIGCRMHLGAGLHERGARMQIQHPLVLLARQLQT